MHPLTKKILRALYIPSIIYLIGFTIGTYPIYKNLIHINFIFEILIFMPILIYYIVKLYLELMEELVLENKGVWDVIFLVFLTYFILGYGIHFVGNEINNFLNESVELAYLYDEIIGHILMYLAIVVISFIFGYIQILNPIRKNLSTYDFIYLVSSGILFGILSGFGIMEGQTPYFGYVVAPMLIALLLYYMTSKKTKFQKLPFIVFLITELVTMIIFTIIYWTVFNGFPQPSEIWK
ncbi:MAG: hypothetical protein ACP6IS_01645 [Candidatus Asgardarchaeia archaeon]